MLDVEVSHPLQAVAPTCTKLHQLAVKKFAPETATPGIAL
jgi:hypothetical protein